MMPSLNKRNSVVFSHLGFYVRDLNRMARFYREVLCFFETDRGLLGSADLVFLSRDPTEHHQIVLATGRPADLNFSVINQVSFRVPDLATLREMERRARAGPPPDARLRPEWREAFEDTVWTLVNTRDFVWLP